MTKTIDRVPALLTRRSVLLGPTLARLRRAKGWVRTADLKAAARRSLKRKPWCRAHDTALNDCLRDAHARGLILRVYGLARITKRGKAV